MIYGREKADLGDAYGSRATLIISQEQITLPKSQYQTTLYKVLDQSNNSEFWKGYASKIGGNRVEMADKEDLIRYLDREMLNVLKGEAEREQRSTAIIQEALKYGVVDTDRPVEYSAEVNRYTYYWGGHRESSHGDDFLKFIKRQYQKSLPIKFTKSGKPFPTKKL